MIRTTAGEAIARLLARSGHLAADDAQAIVALPVSPLRSLKTRADLAIDDAPPKHALFIMSGWACRYRMLEDGRRQLLSLLLPGDLCEVNATVLRHADHTIASLSAVTYVEVPNDALMRLSADRPRVSQALWWHMLVQMAVQREWTVNIGQRSAIERIGHLFCEVLTRLRTTGATTGPSFEFPMTQIDLGEATGLTPVHVNRVLQQMRSAGLVELRGRMLTLLDVAALRNMAMFSPDYLHLDDEPPGAKRVRVSWDGGDHAGR